MDSAALFARAFHEDPFMSWAFPDERRRPAQLRTLFAPVVAAAERGGGLMHNDAGTAASAWLSGRHFPLSGGAQWRSGMLALPLRLPPRALLRVARHENFAEHELRAYVGDRAAYLWVVGVEPEIQGTGEGGRILRAALHAMAEAHDECVLKTENPANLPVYEHLGFRVERKLDSPGHAPPVWVLRRDLGPPPRA